MTPDLDANRGPTHRDIATRALDSAEDQDGWSARFAMLGDINRFRILLALHSAPGITVGELAETVAMTENATSHALAGLRTAGIVKVARDGRYRRWSVCDDRTHNILHSVGATHSSLHAGDQHGDHQPGADEPGDQSPPAHQH